MWTTLFTVTFVIAVVFLSLAVLSQGPFDRQLREIDND